ncbi:MAG: spiro-SPASM protein [Treponema sp.]|nr:spiro-SPASM protein [Treponema sp.]
MKTPLTILFAGSQIHHAFDVVFDGASAFDRALAWAGSVSHSVQTVVFTDDQNRAAVEKATAGKKQVSVVHNAEWTSALVAKEISAACSAHKADFAVFAWADLPFLSSALTKELIDTHTKYLAEYTFADGYPYGLAPEVVDAGAAGIIAALGEGVQKSAGEKTAGRDALFSIMSGDINSFEIETLIAPKDYRMLRLDFSCGEKLNLLSCQRLFAATKGMVNLDSAEFDVLALSDLAETTVSVLQTVPAFYNVQISGRYNHELVYTPYSQLTKTHPLDDMPFADFKKLVAEIASYSEKAVVSLSAFGEPLLHPQFVDCVREVLSYPELTVFVETDGTLVTEKLISELAELDAKRIIWVVLLDAMESNLYAKLHNCAESDFSKAVASVGLLAQHFPHQVYPQMTRMKANESQLEPFYRYWKDKANASAGELIIQKYNNFCGQLPDEKSADLSPLVRNPCWHLRRDMVILSDGTVPLCLCHGADVSMGNACSEGIQTVWERFAEPLSAHLKKDYSAKNLADCKACDEYYTFNF